MKYITPSILFALAVIAFVVWFYARYALAQGPLRARLSPAAPLPGKLTFAGKCHPMEKADRLPVLLITLLYALTAFFQLGNLSAPTTVHDFADGESVTIELSQTIYLTKLKYFSGLGTGTGSDASNCGYNIEISEDGEHWSTLWRRKDDPNDKDKVTGYFWADAEGFAPDYAMKQAYNQLYKWLEIEPENPQNVRYLRITGKADPGKSVLQLSELALCSSVGESRDPEGRLNISPTGDPEGKGITATGCDALFDEGDTVPAKSTWHNSTYFDEIYHARTAKEHIDGVYPYEVTHPPLGKLILGLGIRLFGMTPFGWRFMGTLFGVLMLPILYVFLKNMFGKTPVAACGTTLFACEFMHLTQTRIATIDTYAVFFILCMYFFMYRYLTLPAGTPFSKGALPLFLSGLMWGLGAASKWTVFYAGVGLAVVYFMGLWQKLRDWPAPPSRESEAPAGTAPASGQRAKQGSTQAQAAPRTPLRTKKGADGASDMPDGTAEKAQWLTATLLFSVLCFILLPFAIYTAAYIPYARALEVDLFAHSDKNGLALLFRNVWDTFSGAAGAEGYKAAYIPQDNLLNIMANNQWYMFHYHNGVTSSHPYSAWWFQWVVDARPILYYMDNDVSGFTTRFAAFSNPVVCWGGILAILTCFARSWRRIWSKLVFLWGFGLFAALVTCEVQQTPNGVFELGFQTFFSGEGSEAERGVFARNLVILAAFLVLYLAVSGVIALLSRGQADGQSAFVTVAFLAQLVPWMFVGRTTFEYHYFPSILFLVFAISLLFDKIWKERDRLYPPVLGLVGLSLGLYLVFYPVLIGLQIPTWYEPLVKWIESWPF